MALEKNVDVTTQSKLMAKVIDMILKETVFASRMLRKTKNFVGKYMEFPLKYKKSTSGGCFSGLDKFSTNFEETKTSMQFSPKFWQDDITLRMDSLSKNQNSRETEIIDLMRLEMESKSDDAAEKIGELFYDTNSTNDKNFLGLKDIVDDGSTAATYGGLTRSSYDGLDGYVVASGGTLTRTLLATTYDGISYGSNTPTLGLTTTTIFSFMEKILTPQEQIVKDVALYQGGLKGTMGYTAISYRTVPFVTDSQCDTGYMYLLNEKWLDFYSMKVAGTVPFNLADSGIEGNDISKKGGFGFTWLGKWLHPTDQAALITHMFLSGDLICKFPARQAVITGITTA